MVQSTDIFEYINRDEDLRKLFFSLPDSEIRKITVKRYRKGDLMIAHSSYPKEMFVMLDGICAIVKRSQVSEKPIILNRMGYLDVVGLYEIVWDINRVGDVEARTDCVAAVISRRDMDEWIDRYPRMTLRLSDRISHRYFNHIDYLNYYIKYSAECAVISFFAELYQLSTKKQPEAGQTVRIFETRQEISEEIGRDIRSVNRTIGKLKEEGLITIKNGKIYISDDQMKGLIRLRDSLLDH